MEKEENEKEKGERRVRAAPIINQSSIRSRAEEDGVPLPICRGLEHSRTCHETEWLQ